MTVTTQQYAQLAQHSYAPPEIGASGERPHVIVNGVRFEILKSVDRPSGYQGTIFQRQDTGEIVVAHRGSEFDRQPIKDGLVADGGMIVDRANRQLNDALALTDDATAMSRGMTGRYGQPPQVTVTGHSLGGCLAELTAFKRGLNGETFNPYGAASLNQRVPEGGTQVINHVMAGDLVSAGSKHFGQIRMYALNREVDTLMKIGRYEDDGSKLDIRFAIPAAIASGDSHRMHNFLDLDGNGRPDKSVLSTPAATELAEKHRPMFDKFRSDIFLTREAASFGAALYRGLEGVAGEIGSYLPEKVNSPFKDMRSIVPLDEKKSFDPRRQDHPDHPMHEKIKSGVQSVYSQRTMPFDEAGDRTVAASLADAKLSGLERADHVIAGNGAKSGIDIFIVQGDPQDPTHRRVQVNTEIAAKIPVEDSFQRVDAVNQRNAQVAAQVQPQEQNRSAATRSA